MTNRDEEMVSWTEKFFALKKEVSELRALNDAGKIKLEDVDKKFLKISERMKQHYDHGKEVFLGVKRIQWLIAEGEKARIAALRQYSAEALGTSGMKPPQGKSN